MSEILYYDLKDAPSLSPSLATQMCRELGRRIVGGHLPEGDLIEDETRLAARFSVSKSVVREAVKLLVGKGLLEVRRGDGTRVRRRNHWALLDDDVLAWHLASTPQPSFLRQLMDMRRIIEPKAAAWAATFGTDAQLAEIADAQQRMEQDPRSIEDFVVADALFHRAILRAANNEFLTAMEGVIFSALLSSIPLTNADPRQNKSSIPFHQDLLQAITARNAAEAERAMERHLDDTSTRLAQVIDGFDISQGT
ncbi:FadR/GntR family transcriptional regulator [Paracoccus sp. Z330]|uniref:FadR/GntR family transcriptional regulator n=1 Tax=Paracoccus onchidii TaxID=3017813 RepID=A0ABT4ZAG2_9RHOB|nr:FadR/GntR family transcriptional regulator [Paracoccus onchidii]MDB6176240.1 FadR/GntR family transcriptional regulator [Paracoccus onchidii]